MKRAILTGITAISSAALSAVAFGQTAEEQGAQTLPAYEEGAAVILSGTIRSMGNEEFVLDYGDDQVNVDLEDWEWSDDLQQQLSVGQQVTVSGTVDDDWFERREIEADNIYVTTDYTYYYIVDENPAYTAQQNQRQQQEEEGTFISTRGKVKKISDKMLTVESQGNTIEVDTSELAYDPLDEEGVQQIKEGDRVYVFGDIDENFFETKTITAESLISLNQAGQGMPGQTQGQSQAQPQGQDAQNPNAEAKTRIEQPSEQNQQQQQNQEIQ